MSLTDYVTLGRSGLRVSPLGLGTMTFGALNGWGMDEDEAGAVLDHYLEQGGNFIDCASNYAQGASEEMLGNLIWQRRARNRAVIATKFTRSIAPGDPNAVGNGRKAMMRSLEQSLKRLRTDVIDLYWMHSWDMVTPVEEVLSSLDDLVHQGKILYYGLSDVPAWYATRLQTLAEKEGRSRAVALQLEYSLVERSIEREHLPAAQELGMAVCPWGATAGGLLSGKYADSKTGVEGSGRLTAAGPQLPRFTARNWRVLDCVREAAGELGGTPAQVALAWVASQPGITAPLVGARSLAQLTENLAAAEISLPRELAAKLDTVSAIELVHPYNFFASPIRDLNAGGVRTHAWRPASHPF